MVHPQFKSVLERVERSYPQEALFVNDRSPEDRYSVWPRKRIKALAYLLSTFRVSPENHLFNHLFVCSLRGQRSARIPSDLTLWRSVSTKHIKARS